MEGARAFFRGPPLSTKAFTGLTRKPNFLPAPRRFRSQMRAPETTRAFVSVCEHGRQSVRVSKVSARLTLRFISGFRQRRGAYTFIAIFPGFPGAPKLVPSHLAKNAPRKSTRDESRTLLNGNFYVPRSGQTLAIEAEGLREHERGGNPSGC